MTVFYTILKVVLLLSTLVEFTRAWRHSDRDDYLKSNYHLTRAAVSLLLIMGMTS